MLVRPYRVHCMSMTSVAHPNVSASGHMDRASVALMEQKIEILLRTAASQGSSHVVLGAAGCGVYGCPPLHMAQVFKAVLARCGLNLHVWFAILGSLSNLRSFEQMFGVACEYHPPPYVRRDAAFAFALAYTCRRNECAQLRQLPKEIYRDLVQRILSL